MSSVLRGCRTEGGRIRSHFTRLAAVFSLTLAAAGSTSIARAQCPAWDASFAAPGPDSGVSAAIEFDDGSGNALFVGGAFTRIGTTDANRVARRTASGWTQVGAGFDGRVNAFVVFDDGSGPALYAGGAFTHSGAASVKYVAKWTGAAWVQAGSGLLAPVSTLAVFGAGNGALYAGGQQLVPPISGIARLSTGAWSAPSGGIPGTVWALTTFDPGTGPRLYATGSFGSAGGVPAGSIASFDGSAWADLPGGLLGFVWGQPPLGYSLATFDDGGGTALFVGGYFADAAGVNSINFLKWNGSTWLTPPPIPTGPGVPSVTALRVLDDGGGPALFAGYSAIYPPDSEVTGSVARLAAGGAFVKLGSDLRGSPGALAAFDDGGGRAVFAGGGFTGTLGPGGVGGIGAANLARCKSGAWSAVTSGQGIGGVDVRDAIEFDDGSGPALYVAGRFEHVGGIQAKNIARWDGTSWSTLGAGLDSMVWALEVFDDGSGPQLYAAGSFENSGTFLPLAHVARWNGTAWSAVGGGTDGDVLDLQVHDDGTGSALYAGGQMSLAGAAPVTGVARWKNGAWSSPGTGIIPIVKTLCTFDDGNGAKLCAGGLVTSPSLAGKIARLSGSTWSALGTFDLAVEALASFDDGSGNALHAAGQFTMLGPQVRNHVARWTPTTGWQAVGSGVDGPVFALDVFDDGDGPALYAGGDFATASGGAAKNFARWRCEAWSSPGGGLDGQVNGLAHVESAALGGPGLVIGGYFSGAPGVASSRVAIHRGCTPALASYGNGCAGFAGMVPRLSVAGCPHGSGTIELVIDRGLGGSSALLFLGLARAAIPIGGGCTFLVNNLFPVTPIFPLSGFTAGAGAVTVRGPLPPSVPPVTVRMQAFVIDASNPIGGAGTNGAEMALD